MILKRDMDSMSEVLQQLKIKGEDNEVFVGAKGLITMKGKRYNQNEIRILKTYRFEGESDPDDQAIIYLVKASDGIIGYCIDSYGVYTSHTNDQYSEFIHHAKIATSHSSKIKKELLVS